MTFFERFFSRWRSASTAQTPASGLGLNQPSFQANHMTVDRLHSILRAAEGGDIEQLFALYRDIIGSHSHLQTELNTRKLAVLGDVLAFAAADKTQPQDVLAAQACERLLQCPTWTLGRNHLLNGHLYPVALVEKVWKPAEPNSLGIRYDLAELLPVPYHALDYTDLGQLKLWLFDPQTGIKTGQRIAPRPEDYVIHRGHLLTMLPDYWGGPLRAALFWWLFSVMDRDWWVRFLARFGSPFMVGKYNPNNKRDRNTLARAFASASQLLALVISKDTEVEVMETATNSHGDAFEKMHNIANRELSKLILGQTMTSEAQPQGLGGSQARVHDLVRGDIKQWDAKALAATLQNQIVRQFLAINGLTGRVKIITGAASPDEVKAACSSLETGIKAGLELTDEGVELFSELTGLPFRRAPVPVPVPSPSLRGLPAPTSLSASAAPDWPSYLPSSDTLDQVAKAQAIPLAAAFPGVFAPIRRLILTSASAEDLERRLREHYADHNPAALADLIAPALIAYAANGATATRR